jgi:hypothetical protein
MKKKRGRPKNSINKKINLNIEDSHHDSTPTPGEKHKRGRKPKNMNSPKHQTS